MELSNVKGFIIDLDGTVYTGTQAINGAIEAIQLLQRYQIPFVFLSNRGNYSREMCKMKLAHMGLKVHSSAIVLSSTVTAQFLQQNYKGQAVWSLGDEGLEEELKSHGVNIAMKPEDAKWLVITLHEHLTYEELNLAFQAVRNGAQIIATNADRMFPTERGDSIDVAGMIGAIVYSTGVEVSYVMGKPSTIMASTALQSIGLQAHQCMVVGDSIVSDIGLGKLHGMKTALVLTGNTSKEQADGKLEYEPDYVYDDLLQLVKEYVACL